MVSVHAVYSLWFSLCNPLGVPSELYSLCIFVYSLWFSLCNPLGVPSEPVDI